VRVQLRFNDVSVNWIFEISKNYNFVGIIHWIEKNAFLLLEDTKNKGMKRLIIDMDDVIADAKGQFIHYMKKNLACVSRARA